MTNRASAELSAMDELTPRQHQILKLMQQGKVNKEIARELDISLGTVKQHLVAIFRKLNVQNRTMAVARLAEFKDQSGFDQVFSGETLMAMRPCIVLSLKIDNGQSRAARKRFHTCLSEMAFDCNAFFISREEGEGDLIFGLKRSSAQDMRLATLVADYVSRVMNSYVGQAPSLLPGEPVLSGAIVAGLINISQNRFGGWSGDTVGSHVLTWGHRLRDSAPNGYLVIDQPVQDVMKAFDLTMPNGVPDQLAFSDISTLNDWDVRTDKPLVGRESEFSEVEKLLAGDFNILIVEGENGIGKSRLCREAARKAISQKYFLSYVRVLPTGYLDSANNGYYDQWQDVVQALPDNTPVLVVIDEAHHLADEGCADLTAYMNHLPKHHKVIVSGRQSQVYAFDPSIELLVRKVHLQRLSQSDLDTFFSSADVSPELAERCRGIPLFARELALNEPGTISFALLVTVASRIDKFRVDWKLLYCVASHKESVSLIRLSELMCDDFAYIKAAVNRAVALGVLSLDGTRTSFRHPLVKDVVHYLFKPNQHSDVVSRAS
ncbi:LuxR C-terminal-related transcriptional regulator [Oceanospirillum linum]|uniref:HTH luxR-type domain-containing protein n=1 Tax=Oceanospirillum linum TaxID=966 RepID=A0A1T1HA38_OCELI|nr:LuxR C-terminal-related transcriptional regulator [Oceanospirillum linum]OOV86718.1 hypothetical protein BTA35_0212700 [Oceanospirillum linum]SEG25125.1 ATPase [Oleiphilus messinensis]SMP28132.1 regulatory protein, luxR family [Oceanospirillum linum]